MFKDIRLKANFGDYADKYELNGEREEENEKRYICYTYLSQIQPARLDRDFDLLDEICDSRWEDLDIIGFAIALNDQLLTTATDIDDVLQIEKKGNFELYLLTYKKSINVDEVLSAIKNEKEDTEAAEIIQYMNSQKIVAKWEELPTVNLIIITDEVKDALIQKKEAFVQKTYQINEEKLFRIAKANANEYKTILNFEEEFVLPNKGGEATVVLCKAKQLIDILKNEDDMIRLNLFDENVRAYQGNTDVNNEMIKTLREDPENFVLYNNGITIVCNGLERKAKTCEIEDPQVVNGCQTCNSLFRAYKKKMDLSKVKVIVKIIQTSDEVVTRGIVRGTNRQNIVYEVAFETIRQFHKDLEDFFNVMKVSGFQKVYYERRSKQYYFDSKIKPYQKISFRILIQSMVAMYMNRVEISHRHESKLIEEYKGKLFVEGQSFYPYYVAALLTANLDYLVKKEKKFADIKNYKMHILFLLQELNMGPAPDINDKEEIEKYCKKFMKLLSDIKFENLVMIAADRFRKLIERWIKIKGSNYRFAIKDKPEFTEFMLEELRGNTKRTTTNSIYHGTVLNVNTDKNGNLYGFISCKPNNIYFNDLDNPGMSPSYVGKLVSYKVAGTGKATRGINVKLI